MLIDLDIQEQKWDTLPSGTENMLKDLALKCPFVEGPAVYRARAILHQFLKENYLNPCELYNSGSILQRKKETAETEVQDIKVYPNPSHGYFNVDIPLEQEESAILIVFDSKGKKVLEKAISNGSHAIFTHQFSSGIYYYHILVNNEIRTKDKLVIL